MFITYVVNLVETLFCQEKYEKIYIKLREFEDVCSVLNVKFSKYYQRSRIYFCKKFMVWFFVSIAVEIVIISCIGFSRQWHYFWMFNLVPVQACRMRILHYFYYVNFIKLQAEVINDELRKIVDFTHWNLTSNHVPKIVNSLQILKNAYGISHKTLSIINEIYLFSLASLIIHESIQSGCDYYWMYCTFYEYYSEEAQVAIVLAATIPIILTFFCLSEAQKVENKAAEISVLLHSIRRNKSDEGLFKMVS